MLLEIWKVQSNMNRNLTKKLAIKKLSKQSHLTPNFKDYGSDGIPMEFFEALIPWLR